MSSMHDEHGDLTLKPETLRAAVVLSVNPHVFREGSPSIVRLGPRVDDGVPKLYFFYAGTERGRFALAGDR